MRIAIEVFGTQLESRTRGIGRYSHEFVNALLDLNTGHEFILYALEGANTDYLPGAGRAELAMLKPERAYGERTLCDVLRRRLGSNSDGIDLFVITDPSQLRIDYVLPSPPLNGIKIASIVYDLIPLLFHEQYIDRWPWKERGRLYYRSLERFKRYHALLAISAATRGDCIRHLGIPAHRITNIKAASNTNVFTPIAKDSGMSPAELGINAPYVYSVGSIEFRKNVWGLIEAFAALPEALRYKHLLVLTYGGSRDENRGVRSHAKQFGVLDRLVFTPHIDDNTLRNLYQNCAVFVFPSRYEGFGFPILEAMHCGAAVIAGNNSSQIEIVGNAGLLVDASNPDDLRAKMESVLANPLLCAQLRRQASAQATRFHWKNTAALAMEALESLNRPQVGRAGRSCLKRPRIAVFLPVPREMIGIPSYSTLLIDNLKQHYVVDVYYDAHCSTDLSYRQGDVTRYDYRIFNRNAAILGYHAIVYYHLSNVPLVKWMDDLMLVYPGLVILDETNLTEAASEATNGAIAACDSQGSFLDQGNFAHATGVVLQTESSLEKAKRIYPNKYRELTLVPYCSSIVAVQDDVDKHHSWSRITALYVQAIESSRRGRNGSRSMPRPRPHLQIGQPTNDHRLDVA